VVTNKANDKIDNEVVTKRNKIALIVNNLETKVIEGRVMVLRREW
jgi:hypothetical protein